MSSVVEQCTQALQRGQFTHASALAWQALATTAEPAVRLLLLERLAQAQTGLQDYAAAIQTWQQAYAQATTPADKARLFEQACFAYERLEDYPALRRLAQEQLSYAHSAQERAICLLTAGEALFYLRQSREALQRYLEPALQLVGVRPETRTGLWHALGRCYLAEHAFGAAADAFRQSRESVLGLRFDQRTAPLSVLHHTQLHHACNTAHFYEGAIHLLYHRPLQAVQALQELQPPLTPQEAYNAALFLALAYRSMQQPDAAERALRPLARATDLPDKLRGPYAVVRAGIANARQDTAAVGVHLEAALGAPLVTRAPCEPSWRALLYQELGLALWRAGYRQAAIACYEDSLKLILHQWRIWNDPRHSDWLRRHSLLTALENLPLHTWSAALQSELLRLLQGLAWLYDWVQDRPLVDTALTLALRLATTPACACNPHSLWRTSCWPSCTDCSTSMRQPSSTPWRPDTTSSPRHHSHSCCILKCSINSWFYWAPHSNTTTCPPGL